MTALVRGRFIAPALAMPLAVMLAACGGSSSGGSASTTTPTTPTTTSGSQAGGTACPSSISQSASKRLPSNVPAPAGASAPYQYFPQGATKVWFFAIDGSPSDLPSLRDSYDNALKAKGYKIEGTDQEKNSESESEFKGPHHGTTNFRPLCTGKVVFRLKLTS